jgi:hypothetical protein
VTLLYLQLGDVAAARAIADELAVALRSPSAMLFMPQTAYWSAAQAFHALDDLARTDEMLERANSIVADQASAVSDVDDRSAYLDLGVNREIKAAHERKQWPALTSMEGRARSATRRRKRAGPHSEEAAPVD